MIRKGQGCRRARGRLRRGQEREEIKANSMGGVHKSIRFSFVCASISHSGQRGELEAPIRYKYEWS